MQDCYKGSDEQRRDAAIRQMNVGQKICYIWYYFKWVILLAAAGIVVCSVAAVHAWGRAHTEYLANITIVNGSEEAIAENSYLDRMSEEIGDGEGVFSVDDMKVSLTDAGTSDAAVWQMLAADFLAGDIDFFLADEQVFSLEAENNAFADLRELVSDEFLTEHADQIYYAENSESGETIPVGICLSGSGICSQEGFFDAGTNVILGVGSTYQCDTELAEPVFSYLLK